MSKNNKIQYVGSEMYGFTCQGLPSVREVLCVLFYYTRNTNMTVKECASAVVQRMMDHGWKNNLIPKIADRSCVKRVMSIYVEWTKLTKNTRTVAKNRKEKFIAKLDTLFDISKKNAISIMEKSAAKEKNDIVKKQIILDMNFLKAQYKPYALRSTTQNFIPTKKNKEQELPSESNTIPKDDNNNLKDSDESEPGIDNSTESEVDDTKSESEAEEEKRRSRGRLDVITTEVVQALDVARVSSKNAAVILSAAAKAFGIDISSTNINVTTIVRKRNELRNVIAASVREKLKFDEILTVHWDGKIVASLAEKQRVDRQAIIITGKTTDQLLGAPAIDQGTGKKIAEAVVNHLDEWNVTESVSALCFDTTAVNSGWKNGAAVWIERLLEKDLLWLPCRHHILEIVLGAVFTNIMGKSSSPEVMLFKQFRDMWKQIDTSKYKACFRFPSILNKTTRMELVQFAQSQIDKFQPRDDYLELLELIILFLGKIPSRGVKFRQPGPMHHARWMSKAIYALKIWMFRDQMKVSKSELTGLYEFCIFLCTAYMKAWYTAPLVTSSPYNDLEFIKKLSEFGKVNGNASEIALKKMANHLWYLSPELLPLALFDENLSVHDRQTLAKTLNGKPTEKMDIEKRSSISINYYTSKTIADLAPSAATKFFDVLNIDKSFLKEPVEKWYKIASYNNGKSKVENLHVVNDHAERAVKLFQDYNTLMTKDERTFNNILISVSDHRKNLPKATKSELIQQYGI